MDLYVVRHGIATDRVAGQDDAARPLTARGKKRLKRIVRGLRRLDVELDRVVHSPWLRAVETADQIMALCATGVARVDGGLAEAPTREWLAQLRADLSPDARVAVIGHAPWLSELVALLVHDDATVAARYPLQKGGVVHLHGALTPGAMALVASLPPRVLRRIG